VTVVTPPFLMQALLMAGGGGTRLWPLSTDELPKQFLALFDQRSLLQTTYDRVAKVVPADQIWLGGSTKHAKLLQEHLPQIVPQHVVLEPAKRDNAAAICLNLLLMQQAGISDDEVVVMLPTDHAIGNEAEFAQVLLTGETFLKQSPQFVITIGIQPTHPETGYGYIDCTNTILLESHQHQVVAVNKFVEKPDLATAHQYLLQGTYLWNSGIYLWTVGAMLEAFERLLPDIFQPLKHNLNNWQDIYATLPATSLDYGITEKINTVATIPTKTLEWSDIGDFRALGEQKLGNVTAIDVKNSYICNQINTPIKILGVENIVVVQTEKGLLICNRNRAQEIKKLL
jgi:mannose-1-phosphate guanylyltransferase